VGLAEAAGSFFSEDRATPADKTRIRR